MQIEYVQFIFTFLSGFIIGKLFSFEKKKLSFSFSIPPRHFVRITNVDPSGSFEYKSSEEMTFALYPEKQSENFYSNFIHRNVSCGLFRWKLSVPVDCGLNFANLSDCEECHVVISGLGRGFVQKSSPYDASKYDVFLGLKKHESSSN